MMSMAYEASVISMRHNMIIHLEILLLILYLLLNVLHLNGMG